MSDTIQEKMDGYYIYYETATNDFRCYHSIIKEFATYDVMPKNCSKFQMLDCDGIKANDKGLRAYAKLFKGWHKQLQDNPYCQCINYADKYCNFTAVTCNFNRTAGKHYASKTDPKKVHAPITTTEWRWFERCYNSGLQYLCEQDITVKCYSDDFKNQFPRCMNSNTMIPTKPGKETTLKKLPTDRKDLLPGFYHVLIKSKNDDFRKIFAYSKNDVYVKESLSHAMKHQKQFNVTIELVKDDEPNAYLYKPKDMVTLRSICGEWYKYMLIQRERFPENKLLKHLFKSCWSSMNAGNSFMKTLEEAKDEELDFGYGEGYRYEIIETYFKNGKEKFKLLDTTSPYKFNLRLKPWICALSRNLVAKMALQDIDSVVRIQTDSISFSKKQKFDDEGFVPEAKTTGKMHFLTVNSYKNLTTGYASGFYPVEDSDSDDDN